MNDTFADGTRSIISVLRPKGPGWRELPCNKRLTMGYPARTFYHQKSCLAVISAVEVADDGKISKGPEYHISISKQTVLGPSRCDSNEAKWTLQEFGLDGAEEDNHVPNGVVRNFWRPVAHRLVGLECECKAEEPVIVEDKRRLRLAASTMTSLARQRQQRSLRIDRDLPTRPGASWRRELGIGEAEAVVIPGHVLAAQIHRNGLWPLDLTSALCGDPLPGESAYERVPEVTIAPYDPAHDYVPYQAGISPREKLRQMAQIRGSSRDRRRRTAESTGE